MYETDQVNENFPRFETGALEPYVYVGWDEARAILTEREGRETPMLKYERRVREMLDDARGLIYEIQQVEGSWRWKDRVIPPILAELVDSLTRRQAKLPRYRLAHERGEKYRPPHENAFHDWGEQFKAPEALLRSLTRQFQNQFKKVVAREEPLSDITTHGRLQGTLRKWTIRFTNVLTALAGKATRFACKWAEHVVAKSVAKILDTPRPQVWSKGDLEKRLNWGITKHAKDEVVEYLTERYRGGWGMEPVASAGKTYLYALKHDGTVMLVGIPREYDEPHEFSLDPEVCWRDPHVSLAAAFEKTPHENWWINWMRHGKTTGGIAWDLGRAMRFEVGQLLLEKPKRRVDVPADLFVLARDDLQREYRRLQAWYGTWLPSLETLVRVAQDLFVENLEKQQNWYDPHPLRQGRQAITLCAYDAALLSDEAWQEFDAWWQAFRKDVDRWKKRRSQ